MTLAVAGALLVAGCGSDRSDTTADTADEQLDLGVERATAAALDVRADGCGPRVGFGTGSMIDDRLAITAAHVVAGADDVRVIDIDGNESTAEVVEFDPDLDLAVLRTTESVGRPVELSAVEPQAGDRGVVALPRWTLGELALRTAEIEVVRTVNISTTDIYLRDDVDRPGFEIEATIDPGDSGGLVVLPTGGAGVVWAKALDDTSPSAWAIDLPASVLDDATRDEWSSSALPVSTGPCVR